jgi:hypothetical protein
MTRGARSAGDPHSGLDTGEVYAPFQATVGGQLDTAPAHLDSIPFGPLAPRDELVYAINGHPSKLPRGLELKSPAACHRTADLVPHRVPTAIEIEPQGPLEAELVLVQCFW